MPRLQNLIENILDVAKIESNKTQLLKTQININKVLKEIVEEYNSKIKINSDHSFNNNASGGLNNFKINLFVPPDPVIVNADNLKIYQVITNLLDNAVKSIANNPRINGNSVTIYLCRSTAKSPSPSP